MFRFIRARFIDDVDILLQSIYVYNVTIAFFFQLPSKQLCYSKEIRGGRSVSGKKNVWNIQIEYGNIIIYYYTCYDFINMCNFFSKFKRVADEKYLFHSHLLYIAYYKRSTSNESNRCANYSCLFKTKCQLNA